MVNTELEVHTKFPYQSLNFQPYVFLMILKRIKKLINEFRFRDERLRAQNDELEWAHIYHDTIKDKEWLKNLAISPGRWAGNYSLLYVLVRILSDFKPNKIIEFGLGESSKIVSSFLKNELQNSTHLIIEQDENWIESFRSRFNLSKNSELLHLPLEIKKVKSFPVKSFNHIEKKVNGVFDLYIVDGPVYSSNYSRYDICLLAERFRPGDEFIIVIDDYSRAAEKETVTDLVNQLSSKEIKTHTGVYAGNKSQIIIATEKYRFVTTL
jgi:hypothetical protein